MNIKYITGITGNTGCVIKKPKCPKGCDDVKGIYCKHQNLRCGDCCLVFTTPELLTQHKRMDHPRKRQNLCCHICSQLFARPALLTRHKNMCHTPCAFCQQVIRTNPKLHLKPNPFLNTNISWKTLPPMEEDGCPNVKFCGFCAQLVGFTHVDHYHRHQQICSQTVESADTPERVLLTRINAGIMRLYVNKQVFDHTKSAFGEHGGTLVHSFENPELSRCLNETLQLSVPNVLIDIIAEYVCVKPKVLSRETNHPYHGVPFTTYSFNAMKPLVEQVLVPSRHCPFYRRNVVLNLTDLTWNVDSTTMVNAVN